jgi:hypothetical protein
MLAERPAAPPLLPPVLVEDGEEVLLLATEERCDKTLEPLETTEDKLEETEERTEEAM